MFLNGHMPKCDFKEFRNKWETNRNKNQSSHKKSFLQYLVAHGLLFGEIDIGYDTYSKGDSDVNCELVIYRNHDEHGLQSAKYRGVRSTTEVWWYSSNISSAGQKDHGRKKHSSSYPHCIILLGFWIRKSQWNPVYCSFLVGWQIVSFQIHVWKEEGTESKCLSEIYLLFSSTFVDYLLFKDNTNEPLVFISFTKNAMQSTEWTFINHCFTLT